MKFFKKNVILKCLIIYVSAYFLISCQNQTSNENQQNSEISITSVTENTENNITETTMNLSQNNTESKVQKLLDSMSLEEKIYQMFIVTPEQLTGVNIVVQAGDTTKLSLENHQVGGIIYFSQNLRSEEQTKEMLSNTQNFMKDISGIGLFLCVDEEGGYIARIGDNLPSNQFNVMSAYGENPNPEEAYNIGVGLAENLSRYGFNVDFAPVSDVDLNIENGLHEYGRCFSENPEDCAIMVENIVKGLQDNNISATIKHFPGLGSTYGDTHDDRVYLDRTKEEFQSIDFIPIIAGINAGTDFVMVSHMVINDNLSDGLPCDLSKSVVNGWLREELNYDGIIITDSHQMSAITNYYSSGEATVKAIQSGVDIVLMPEDLKLSVNAVIEAIKNDEISIEQINSSVTRILNQKEQLGLLY